jgi:guanylate kinase
MKLLAFIGPSGAGKSTIVRELHRRGVVVVTPSWTTRPSRSGEDEIEHRFVSEKEFAELQRDGFFLEVVQMFGLPYRYGLPPVEQPVDGRIPAVMVRASLLPLLGVHYPDHVVYQIEAAADTARARMRARGEDAEADARLAGFEQELDLGRGLADRVFDSGTPINEIVDVIARAVRDDFQTEGSNQR